MQQGRRHRQQIGVRDLMETYSGEQVGDQVQTALARRLDRVIIWIARHWLALFNSVVALYLLLPVLAPALAKAGLTTPAAVLYTAYSVACHQLPERSYFLFGEEPLYSLSALEARGLGEGLGLFQRRAFRGNEITGYKIAICQRDLAIYGSVLLAGLLFGLARARIRALSMKVYLLFLIPIALDGLTQLFGARQSDWWLRTVTGALFGGASVWLAYPYLESVMQDVIRTEETRLRNKALTTAAE